MLQLPAEMTVPVGHRATLHCNFSTSTANPYIFWYQQHQCQPPQMLLAVSKYKARVSSGRFSSVLSAQDSQVLLHVQHVELQDSAVYFCALSPQRCPQLAALHRIPAGVCVCLRVCVCALRVLCGLLPSLPLLACSSELSLASSGTWALW